MTQLDTEEQDFLTSYEKEEWVSQKNSERTKILQSYAEETLGEEQEITLSLSGLDVKYLQIMANQAGIPYQSFISGILHQYVTGKLVEKISRES